MKYLLGAFFIVLGGVILSLFLFSQYKNYEVPVGDIINQDNVVFPVDPEVDLIRGNPKARYFIVEYVDFQCPFCKKFHRTIKSLVNHKYFIEGQVAWVLRHSPILDEISLRKAEAVMCVQKYHDNETTWKFVDNYIIHAEERTFDTNVIEVILEGIKRDPTKVLKCVNEREMKRYAEITKKQAFDVLDIYSTPYVQFITFESNLVEDFSREIVNLGYDLLVAIVESVVER